MWFKNTQLFRLNGFSVTPAALSEQLSRIKFSKAASNEMMSIGWAVPRENLLGTEHELVYASLDCKQLLICLAVDKKILPGSVINEVTKERAKEIEDQQGFAPGRKAMKDLKERVTDELLPRAFSKTSRTNVWIDLENQMLAIDAPSSAAADEVVKFLLKCVDKVPLESLRVKTAPQTAMTGWLAANESPKGFTIDQDTELKSATEDKATVRYVRHTLEPDQIGGHIAAGKQCTKLALTWDDRISFVLTDTLCIKRIKPLDILDEDKEKGTNEEERFDADFLLMTAEISKMLVGLIESLDGELPST